MLKIFALHLEALGIKLLFTFMQFVLRTISNFPIISEKFGYYVEQLQTAFDNVNEIYLKTDRIFLSQAVQQTDDERDKAFRYLRDSINLVILNDEKTKIPSAEILLKVIDLYGGAGIIRQKFNEESASLTNLIEDFEQKYQQEVAEVGITTQLQELKTKNEAFLTAYYNRANFDSKLGKGAMVQARKELSEAYRSLVTVINLAAKRDVEGQLTPFINLINTEVCKYRSETGQGQPDGSQGTDLEEEEETDGEAGGEGEGAGGESSGGEGTGGTGSGAGGGESRAASRLLRPTQ